MEYSKEFVTAVVLGKDLVPRQVEECLNSLMNLCCSVLNNVSCLKHLDHLCLQLPHFPVLLLFPVSVFFLDTFVGVFLGKSLLSEGKG